MNRERGYATLLLDVKPGTRFPAHHHTGAEECYVISGGVYTCGRRMGPATSSTPTAAPTTGSSGPTRAPRSCSWSRRRTTCPDRLQRVIPRPDPELVANLPICRPHAGPPGPGPIFPGPSAVEVSRRRNRDTFHPQRITGAGRSLRARCARQRRPRRLRGASTGVRRMRRRGAFVRLCRDGSGLYGSAGRSRSGGSRPCADVAARPLPGRWSPGAHRGSWPRRLW